MFRRLSLTLLALAIFGVAGRQGYGSLIMLNDPSIDTAIANGQFGALSAVSGNGFNLTLDIDTNLEWLDVSVTRGLTRAQVSNLIGSGSGTLSEFRYATIQELASFMRKNGMSVPVQATGAAALPQIANATAFTHVWGGDTPVSGLGGIDGFYGEFLTSDGVIYMAYGTIVNSLEPLILVDGAFFVSDGNDLEYQGSALIRESVVPEPNSMLLFLIGCCLTPNARMRRG